MPPQDALFRIDGAFLDAAVAGDQLYLLAGAVAVGEPDIQLRRLGVKSGMEVIGRYTALDPPLSILVADGRLLLAEGDHGLEVANVRDPIGPRRVTQVPLEGYSHRAVWYDGVVLVASGFGGLHLLDIRYPAGPPLLSSYQVDPPPSETTAEDVDFGSSTGAEQAAGSLLAFADVVE